MIFHTYIKTLHSKICSLDETMENQRQHEFLASLLEIAAEGDIEVDLDNAKNWLRTDRNDRGYRKFFIHNKFADAKFSTRIKSKTMTNWVELQQAFKELHIDGAQSIINYYTNNHDKFVESIEWQLKIFLGLSFIVKDDAGRIKMFANFEDVLPEFNPKVFEQNSVTEVDIYEIVRLRSSKKMLFKQIWIVSTNLFAEIVLLNYFPEIISNCVMQNISYVYFTYNQKDTVYEKLLKNQFLKYGTTVQVVYLSQKPSNKDYFCVPRHGYLFCFLEGHESESAYGYGFHQLYAMDSYEAYRMHNDDVLRRLSVLDTIKDRHDCE